MPMLLPTRYTMQWSTDHCSAWISLPCNGVLAQFQFGLIPALTYSCLAWIRLFLTLAPLPLSFSSWLPIKKKWNYASQAHPCIKMNQTQYTLHGLESSIFDLPKRGQNWAETRDLTVFPEPDWIRIKRSPRLSSCHPNCSRRKYLW